MELHEKLQQLRKQKGLTQEQLAESLFVSRTAVSKWEQGRGYPNIDSLKAIAKFFNITIDELLSGDELLTIAQEDNAQTQGHFLDLIFGLLDCSLAMFFFLPLFGQASVSGIQAVSLLALTEVAAYLKAVYFTFIIGSIALGILTLALQNCRNIFWMNRKRMLSLGLNGAAVLLLIISQQPYAATFLFVFLGIKVFFLVKKQ